jgi:hypothetical protein
MNFQPIRAAAVTALKKNLKPGLVLQAFAGIIVSLYFFVPATKPAFDLFAELKQQHGWLYSAISTSLFGGLIPFLYLYFSKSFKGTRSIKILFIFYIFFWAYKGVEVDYFYRLQTYLFGSESNFTTLAIKVMVDQFIYSAFWAAPGISIIYLWIACGFNWQTTRKNIDKQFLTVTLPANIISNWLVWIPAVCFIYSMPTDLQIPLFGLVLCFWVLILAVLNNKSQ